jgi:hypothetical protein
MQAGVDHGRDAWIEKTRHFPEGGGGKLAEMSPRAGDMDEVLQRTSRRQRHRRQVKKGTQKGCVGFRK